MLNKLLKDKKGKFFDYTRFPSLGNVVFWFILAMIITFFVNFLLNQLFGFNFLKLGQPFRFLLIGLPVASVAYMIIKKQGSLDRSDIIIIMILSAGALGLVYYLPTLVPEIFSSVPFDSIWTEAASKAHDIIQSVIPIP